MAKLLQQLLPQGGTYGFVMQWNGDTNNRNRIGFNREMIPKLRDDDGATEWKEVETYPYEHPYNHSVPCDHLTCQMEGLVTNRTVDALVFLFETPIRNPLYQEWVDNNRHRNLTLISTGSGELALSFLKTGYLHGLLSAIYYEYGVMSAKVLHDTATKLRRGEISLPLNKRFYETQTLAHSVIPTDLDTTHPPKLDQNLLGNLVYVGFILFGIVALSALCCAIWTYINRSAIVVRAAQPFFLLILLSGIVIFSSAIIPLSFDDGGDPDSLSNTAAVAICMSQPWLAFLGFTVIFSALFSKTWRVNKLFHTERHHTRIKVTHTDVLGPFAVIFTCNVVVLTCWTVIDPLTYTRLVGEGTDLWNREIESYGACRSDKALAFLIPLSIINFMVLGIACWQAFEARFIQSAFSESKYIGLSVASLLQAFLTGLPILAIVRDEPRAFYMVLTLMVFVLSESILLMIFLPKMQNAYAFSKLSEAEQKKVLSEQIKSSHKASTGMKSDHSNGLESSQENKNTRQFDAAAAPSKQVLRDIPETNDAVAGASTTSEDLKKAIREVVATQGPNMSSVTDPISSKEISMECREEAPESMPDVSEVLISESEQTITA
jgi:gamma-aminobutyric acid type B receptor